MKNPITKIILKNLDVAIACFTLSLCVVIVNVNILCRYIFRSPLQWSEEVVTSLFVWTVFMGCSYAHRKKSHLGVDVLVAIFPEKTRKIIAEVVFYLEIIILIMITIISSQYVYHLIVGRGGKIKIMKTETLMWPMWITAIAVPIGFGLCTLHSLRQMLVRWGLIKDSLPEATLEVDTQGMTEQGVAAALNKGAKK